MQYATLQLKRIAQSRGFTARGNAVFRVNGDGVLQILKFQKQASKALVLSVGLQSLYSELLPQWFYSWGCIPRYTIANLCGERFVYNAYNCNERYSIDWQLNALECIGFSWLEDVSTQLELANALIFLDQSEGAIMWNDDMKIAPFLFCKNFELAEKVIVSILHQHKLADAYKDNTAEKCFHNGYLRLRNEEDAKLEHLLAIIQQKNWAQIQKYLSENYAVNAKYANFCMK